jgi:serine/threonine-protein kinase
MPPPATVAELIDRVRRSGIVPADRLEGFLVGMQTSGNPPTTAGEALDRLREAGMITRFHAEKLAVGKYKGFHIGSYLILDQLGSGGMGHVFLAEHINMHRLVALKVLPPQAFEHDPVAKERFFREARAAGTLDHPNIVRVFDLCQEGKLLYLVMEYADGISLQAMVARHGPLDIGAACHYAGQVAFGLQHAHELGFVHRDIKPANLLLDRTGVVKILDFGLVRSEAETGVELTKQLGDRSILGTADYVAPEQAMDSSKVDIRADIYSLGATLYFLLAGRTLFPEGKTAQKLVWQQIKDPVPLERLRPEVPPELAEVIHSMLRKRPADRPQTPAEVVDALVPFVPEDVAPPDPAWLPQPARLTLATAAARMTGSATSQILAAAMRGGSGTTSGSKNHRRLEPDRGTGETARIGGAHTRGRGHSDGGATTSALGLDETQRTPAPDRRPEPAPGSLPHPTIVIGSLAAALILALIGIIILLLGR